MKQKSNKRKKQIIFLIASLTMIIFFSGCINNNFIHKFGTNITAYQLNLTLNEDNTLSGTEKVNYKNTTSNILNEVYFHLYANSFSDIAINKPVSKLYETKAYPNGLSYGKIEIQDVKANNDKCLFSLENTDMDLLKVTFNTPLYPNDFIQIDMTYLITIPNVLHRFGYNDKTINLGNFYPIACVFDSAGWDKNPYNSNGDPFYSSLANYEVNITYNEDLILASTGIITETSSDSKLKTSKISAKAVRDFAMVFSKEFKVMSENIESTQINYFYYDDQNPSKSLETSVKALKTFNKRFGLYPYESLAVVETGFLYGGMEYPNLVMISDNLEKYDDYTNTIIHEIAHQWWYGVVGNNEFSYGWLDESLAEYSVVIFYELNPEYEIKREVCVQNAITSYTLFIDVYKDVFKQVDTSMNRQLNEFKTEPEYVYAAYVKGLIMFDDIRNIIGDRNFFKSLSNYYKQYGGKNATPDNLISVFENTSNKNLKSIFTSYLDGSAIIGNLSDKNKSNK